MGEGERVGDEGEEMGVKGKKTEKEGGEDCVGCDDQACVRLRALRQRWEISAFCLLFIALFCVVYCVVYCQHRIERLLFIRKNTHMNLVVLSRF